MKLTRLSVRRMPGFEHRAFDLEDLSAGLNLIVGPNASGKTTTCRALRGLLWPETLEDVAPVSLVGHWQEDESQIRIELEGSRCTCQTDGQPSEPPPLPAPHLAECFTVTVGTLLQATEGDAQLARSVVREMAGGYDLEAVLREFTISPRYGQAEARARNDATQNVRRVQQEQQSLQDDEADLGELERQKVESRRAQARLTRLEDVRQLLEARALIAEATGSLDELPAGMDRLNGGEEAALEQLRGDLREEENRRQEAERDAEQAQAEKEEAALPAEGISQGPLREQQARIEDLRDAEQRIDNISSEIVRARSHVNEALNRLGGDADSENLDAIDLPELDSVETLHREAEQLRARRAAVEERLAALGEEQGPEETETLVEAIRILRQWFEVPAEPRPSFGRDKIVAWGLASATVVVGLALGIFVNPWALLAAGIGVVGALLLWVMRLPATQDGRQGCRERYQRLSLDPPKAWDAAAVGRHLNGLEQRLAKARTLEHQQSERRNRKAELDRLGPVLEDIDRRRASLSERLGVPLSTSDLALVTFAQDLVRYRQARDTLLGQQKQLSEIQARRDEQLTAINGYLARFGEEPSDSYDVARVRSEAIAERAERYRTADARLVAAHRELSSAQERIDGLLGRKRRFFEELGLSEDDEAGLAERLRRLPEYRDMRSRLTEYRGREAASLDRLSDAPDLQEMNRESLEDEASRLQGLANRHQDLVDRIATVRAAVDRARRGSTLQDALAALDEATDRLAQRRDEAIQAAAGQFLLSLVQEEQQAEHQPAVLRQARQWLGEFTRGRYDLQVGTGAEEGAGFRAYDNTQQRGLDLSDLSGGTRMQLLLAVRLAFAASAERGVQLPFVLDEALSGTDPIRFRAIVECLTTLIHQGRQVFYLTCQPGDAKAWQEVTEQQGVHAAKQFDLARIRDLQQSTGDLLVASAAASDAVPAPEGRTLSEYASAVSVPDFDPAQGSAGLHMAFLVDEPDHLYDLLRAGIQRYGQLKALFDRGRADAYLPAEAARKAVARAVVVQAVCDCWKVGQGHPLTREALHTAGVSDSFIDRVSDLARDLDWDASQLVDALEARDDERAKGFRTAALESIKEALATEGYLDPRDPLTEPEALTRVLSSAGEAVQSGHLDPDEVRALFEHFWSLATHNGGGR